MKQEPTINVAIEASDLRDHMDEEWFDQLEKSGRLASFMEDIEGALYEDFFDEIDYFVDEYGLNE